MAKLWIIAAISCPITAVKSVPVSLYQVLAANTATYALVGLIVETVQQTARYQRQQR